MRDSRLSILAKWKTLPGIDCTLLCTARTTQVFCHTKVNREILGKVNVWFQYRFPIKTIKIQYNLIFCQENLKFCRNAT